MSSPFLVRGAIQQALANRETHQASIDVRPHFVPLDIKVLSATLANMLDPKLLKVSTLKSKLVAYVKSKRYLSIVSKGGLLYAGSTIVDSSNIKMFTPAIVYSNSEIKGLLFAAKNSYESTRRGIFQDFLNSPEISRALVNSTGFDVGHTLIDGLATTPLAEGINAAKEEILKQGLIASLTKSQRQELEKVFNTMEDLSASLDIHAEYGYVINTSLSKSFSKSLLSVQANIVFIQDRTQNQRDWGQVIEGKLKSDIVTLLRTVNFSNNLEEEVVQQISNTLLNKKIASTTKQVKLPDIVKKSKKVNVTSSKESIDTTSKLRTLQNRSYSLASLQVLLNQHLQHVIAANMGDGGQRSILNYRTGRFAASAKVERLSESRAGMITAFYTYMKNPYQTFEPGFEQGSKTRDPKALISKSIKEIAATKVGNRMRAVLV